MKVLHIITSLDAHGAQRVLIQLLELLKESGYEQAVICMKSDGPWAPMVENLKIPLFEISFSLLTFFRARRQCDQIIASFQPDLIQTWMYHADFLSNFLNNPRRVPIVWNIQHTFERQSQTKIKFATQMLVRLNAFFSRHTPERIICCSQSGLKSHKMIGYQEKKMVFIPNGVDVDRFIPDQQAKTILRHELELAHDTPLIGYIARYHPQKDHGTFFTAARLVLQSRGDVHFVLAGDGMSPDNVQIRRLLTPLNNHSHFHFLGRRDDVPLITAGLDIAVLTSSGDEGFPSTIIEAMACEIPCVATDAGDVKEIIGPCGLVTSPQNPAAIAEALLELLNKDHEDLLAIGRCARERVVVRFTQEVMAQQYMQIYHDVSWSLRGDLDEKIGQYLQK